MLTRSGVDRPLVARLDLNDCGNNFPSCGKIASRRTRLRSESGSRSCTSRLTQRQKQRGVLDRTVRFPGLALLENRGVSISEMRKAFLRRRYSSDNVMTFWGRSYAGRLLTGRTEEGGGYHSGLRRLHSGSTTLFSCSDPLPLPDARPASHRAVASPSGRGEVPVPVPFEPNSSDGARRPRPPLGPRTRPRSPPREGRRTAA